MCKILARFLRMKKLKVKQATENQLSNEGAHIEISESYIAFSKSRENVPLMQHAQNIKCFLKKSRDKDDEEENEEQLRQEQQIKFKYAAIVMDRLFLFISLACAVLSFGGLFWAI